MHFFAMWCLTLRRLPLESLPEGHWREPVTSVFAVSPGGGTRRRESGGSAQVNRVKGQDTLPPVYTQVVVRFSPSGH